MPPVAWRLVLASVLALALALGAAAPLSAEPVDGRALVDGSRVGRAEADRRLPSTAAQSGERGYVWPTGGQTEVLRGFEPPANPWGPGHRGVDLAHPAGADVLSAGAGVVAFAGWVVDRHVVSIDHADGLRTTYEPVEAIIGPGDVVAAGEPIGHLSAGHCDDLARRPGCLHWGARTGPGSYIDPMILLGDRPVIRLLPSGGR